MQLSYLLQQIGRSRRHAGLRHWCTWLSMLGMVLGGMLAGQPACAQATTQVWFTYLQQATLSKRWGYTWDVNYRISKAEQWQSAVAAVRAGAVYQLSPTQRLSGGYAWFGQWANLNSERILLHENRLWQQWLWQQQRPTVSWFHRVRLEQRWRQLSFDNTLTDTYYSTRYRYMFQLNGFLHKPAQGWRWKWVLANEIMGHSGQAITRFFEQNRLIGGVIAVPGKHSEIACLYQYTVQQPIQRAITHNHIIRLTWTQQLDWQHHY